MPCRCDDRESDEGYWDSYPKVLMEQLVGEINNNIPLGMDKEYVRYAWIKAFDHLLKGCSEKNNPEIDSNKSTEISIKDIERVMEPYERKEEVKDS